MATLSNEQLQSVLNSVWEKSLPLLRQRVIVLRKAAQARRDGSLTDELRNEAADESHRLAGLLGTFGYPEGTDAARLLELVFDPDLEAGAAPDASSEVIDESVALLGKIVGA